MHQEQSTAAERRRLEEEVEKRAGSISALESINNSFELLCT